MAVMKKDDIILLVLAAALLVAAIITCIRGGEKSRHGGYGVLKAPVLFHIWRVDPAV